MMIWNYQLQLG